jgi:hypothetical protein
MALDQHRFDVERHTIAGAARVPPSRCSPARPTGPKSAGSNYRPR